MDGDTGAVIGTVAVEAADPNHKQDSDGFTWCAISPSISTAFHTHSDESSRFRAVFDRFFSGWCRTNGDAELRRMSVAHSARGRGVAKALFVREPNVQLCICRLPSQGACAF